MKPALKVAIVVGGYLLSFLTAWAAVTIHEALADSASSQASSGMSAFGDLVLFVAVFGVAAMVPTSAGLYFIFSRKKG